MRFVFHEKPRANPFRATNDLSKFDGPITLTHSINHNHQFGLAFNVDKQDGLPRKAPIGRPVYKPTTTQDRFVRGNFVVGKLLRKGAFGLVRQCQLKATKSVIAAKKIAQKTRLNAVKAEFGALSMIGQKPYIVPVYALI
ncbi:unnamed protein product, partial [Mesorhabditis belari]|uniref:Protein kinase domain-containing protein n=1 Tax=Mesorhabditis belari TaxID=2138241 RepID=A0AAF3EHS3_9BILA